MTKYLLLLSFLFLNIAALQSQNLYFPPITGNTWDTVSTSSLGWCDEQLDSLKHYLEVKNTKAFIILKDGKIAVEWYLNGFGQDSLWYWASAGKSLMAMLVGIAQEEGHLSIQDQTAQHLGMGWTDCTSIEEQQITIWNQLTMTSGLDDGTGDVDCTLDTCLQCIATPNTRWAYHNAPYSLLRDVVENATGSNINTYYKNKIGDKIGADGAYIKLGYINLFFSTPRAMARYGLLALNKGKWDNTTVLGDTTYANAMVNTSQTLNKSYGYLWWLNGKGQYRLPGLQLSINNDLLPKAPSDLYAALGKNDQKIYIVPSQNLVVIRMGNAAQAVPLPTLSGFDNTVWEWMGKLDCNATAVATVSSLDFKIFPNPARDFLTIQTDDVLKNVEVLNLQGQVLLVENSKTINLSSLPSGIYFIKIITAKGKVGIRKILVE